MKVFNMLTVTQRLDFLILVHKGLRRTVQKVEFVSDGMSYINNTRLLMQQCFLKIIGTWHKICFFAQQTTPSKYVLLFCEFIVK